MDIEKIHKDSIALLYDIFPQYEQLDSKLFYYRPDGRIFCLAGGFGSDQEKTDLWNFYSMILQFEEAIAYTLISEAWFATQNDSDLMPRDRDDKKEGVIIFTRMRKIPKTIGSIFEIIRTENDKELKLQQDVAECHDNINFFERIKIKNKVGLKNDPYLTVALENIPWRFEVDKEKFCHTEV